MHDWGTGDTQVQSKCVGCSFSVQVPKMEDLKKKKNCIVYHISRKAKTKPKHKWYAQNIKIESLKL